MQPEVEEENSGFAIIVEQTLMSGEAEHNDKSRAQSDKVAVEVHVSSSNPTTLECAARKSGKDKMAEQYCSRDCDKWGEVDKVKDAQVEDVIEIEVGNRCSENAIVNKFVGESCIEENGPMLYNIDCWHLNDQGDELVEDFSHLESLFQHNKENCIKEIEVATGLGSWF